MNLNDIALKPAASAGGNVLNSASAGRGGSAAGGMDFKALFSQNLAALKADYAETGLTAAEQVLWAAGGDTALQAKEDLEKKGSALFTDEKDAKESTDGTGRVAATETETIRRFMPDGSILMLTYENGKVVDEYRKKPQLVEKPDLSRPAKIVNGEEKPQTKLVPRLRLFDDMM